MEQYFLEIINMSVITSLVIICVLLLRIILKKVPTVFSYLLWGIVFFRLLCPISFESVIGIFPSEIAAISTDVMINERPNITAETMVQEVPQVVPNEETQIEDFVPNEKHTRAVSKLNFITGAMYVWILGMVIFSGYSVLQFIKFKKKLVGAIPLEKGIYLVDYIQTPFILGIIQPKIYLPTGLTMEEREYIMAHERIHIVRLDNITRIFAFLALILHWFNPLVWVAYFLSEKDMELSCDEAVLKKMSESHQIAYAKTLLHMATGRKLGLITPLAFGEGNPKERIENIMKYKKTKIWVSIILLCFIGVAIFVLGSNRMENKEVIMGNTVKLEGIPVFADTNWGMDVQTTMKQLGIEEGTYQLTKNSVFPKWSECVIEDYVWNGWSGTLILRFDDTKLSNGNTLGLTQAAFIWKETLLVEENRKEATIELLGIENELALVDETDIVKINNQFGAVESSYHVIEEDKVIDVSSETYEWKLTNEQLPACAIYEDVVEVELEEYPYIEENVIATVFFTRDIYGYEGVSFDGRVAAHYTQIAYEKIGEGN